MLLTQVRNRILTVALALLSVGLVSCSGSADGEGSDKNNISAADRQKIVNQAREAAGKVIAVSEGKDTFAIQQKLLEARTLQSHYVEAGRKAEAELYDSAFIQTLRAARPQLAREIEAATRM